MMRRLLLSMLMLLCSTALLAQEAERNSYLVATRGPAEGFRIRDFIQRVDTDTEIKPFRLVNGFAAELTAQEVAELRRSPRVLFVEPDPIRYASSLGADTQVRNRTGQTVPYGVNLVKAGDVWQVASGATIKIGVLDTGIDGSHPDLKHFYRGGRDFVQNDDDPSDPHGHGTHVAGTIAAANNDIGVVGVAPNVELYGLRVLNAQGSGRTSDVIRAVDWAVQNKLHVLNLSLGSSDSSVLEEQAFQRATDAGLLVFAASGNCYSSCTESPGGVKDGIDYPGGYPTVISVGAIDSASRVASFSQRGSGLKVVAPGVAVLSTYRTGVADISDVTFADKTFVEADRFTNAPLGEFSGPFVPSGLGRPQDMNSAVNGRIAVIQRGQISFAEKVRNAMAAGAKAVVIYNNLAEGERDSEGRVGGPINGVLCLDYVQSVCKDAPFDYVLAVGVSKEDGQRILATSSNLTVSTRPDDYSTQQGTSMATPHAAGVAALVWSVNPNATAAQVRDAILTTTVDLGAAGFDTTFGHGLVDAIAAAKKLAPERFVSSPPPADRSVRRRR
jgi:serine protease